LIDRLITNLLILFSISQLHCTVDLVIIFFYLGHTWLHSVLSVVVRASDSTGREFDSRPCSADLGLLWVTVCGRVNHLGM